MVVPLLFLLSQLHRVISGSDVEAAPEGSGITFLIGAVVLLATEVVHAIYVKWK
jgi:hypothetical protein